jgi:hypothetical protein
MADDVDKLCSKVALIGGERDGITITEGEVAESRDRGERCLVGRIGEERRVNKEAFRTVMTRLWRIAGTVVFKEVQENIWVFEFSDRDDKGRILAGRPWSFDRQIIILNELDGNVPPSQMQFTHSPFWVQVHDLPLVCMNISVGTKIGESLGSLVDVDVAGDGMGWGHCLRIRVVIDLRNPLERGRAIHLNGKSHWVTFKYEKLPMFYFTCGRLLHGDLGCPERKLSRQQGDVEAKPWGVWLRADLGRRRSGFSGGYHNGSVEGTGGGSQADTSEGRWDERGSHRAPSPSVDHGGGSGHGWNPTPPRLHHFRGEVGLDVMENVTKHIPHRVVEAGKTGLTPPPSHHLRGEVGLDFPENVLQLTPQSVGEVGQATSTSPRSPYLCGTGGVEVVENVTKHMPQPVGEMETASSTHVLAGDNCMAVTRKIGVGCDMGITRNMGHVAVAGVISGDNVQIMEKGTAGGAPGGERTAAARTVVSCPREGQWDACMEGAYPEDNMEGPLSTLASGLSPPLHTVQLMQSVDGSLNAEASGGDGDVKLRRWKRQARGVIGSGSQTGTQPHAGPTKRSVDRTFKGSSGDGKRQKKTPLQVAEAVTQVAVAGNQPRHSP